MNSFGWGGRRGDMHADPVWVLSVFFFLYMLVTVVALEIIAKGFSESPVTTVAICFHVAQGKEKS